MDKQTDPDTDTTENPTVPKLSAVASVGNKYSTEYHYVVG